MDNLQHKLRLLTHGYIICTLLGFLTIFHARELSMIFFAVGANSVYISLGAFLSPEVGKIGTILAIGWFILFPLMLLVSYVCAHKKNDTLWKIAITIDVIPVAIWAVFSLASGNTYGFKMAVFDILCSIVYIVVFYHLARKAYSG